MVGRDFLENMAGGLSGDDYRLVRGWLNFMAFHGLNTLRKDNMPAEDWTELQTIIGKEVQ